MTFSLKKKINKNLKLYVANEIKKPKLVSLGKFVLVFTAVEKCGAPSIDNFLRYHFDKHTLFIFHLIVVPVRPNSVK